MDFAHDEAVDIDQQNQAAVGRNGGAGKQLDLAQIFAQILDDDFILAQNFFHHHAHLASAHVDQHQAQISVDRLQARQLQGLVEAHHLGDHVAHLGNQLAANLFDLAGTDAADLLHKAQREGEGLLPALHKQRLRDDERERNLEGEAGAEFLSRSRFRLRR